jgi:hypothetical protein
METFSCGSTIVARVSERDEDSRMGKMFESKDDLKAEIKLLTSKLDIMRINFEGSERARECLRKEMTDALKVATEAKSNADSLMSIHKVLSDKLNESGIVQGYIKRIEQAPSDTAYGRSGILLTVRVDQPWHPSGAWGGGPTDENGKTIYINDPANANHPKVKPIMDKYRREMNEYNAFHVGQVYLKMPALEKE